MTYTILPELYRGLLLVFSTLILILYIYGIIRIVVARGSRLYIIISVLLALATFAIYQGMIMYQQGDIPMFEVPVRFIVPALVVLFLFTLYMQIDNILWRKRNISGLSVQEAFDHMPMGLAYFTKSGLPVMVNEKMRSVSKDLFGGSIYDANEFRDEIKAVSEKELPDEGDQSVVKLHDGRMLSIRVNSVNVNDNEVYELTAIDVSREYEMAQKLKESRIRAENINRRLKVLMESIEYVTMNRELLALKTALHDNIGQSILIARRYLHDPKSVDRNGMLKFWRDNIKHLIDDKPEEWELPYYVTSREADRMGIHLEIIGELPSEPHLISVVDSAISVAVGNTLKHTDGKCVTVRVLETDEVYTVSFTNDGEAPKEDVTEKGGLTSLRTEVENAGGNMIVFTSPVYMLRVVLPKGGGIENGL